MSGTIPAPPASSPAVTLWGAPVVTVLAYGTFLAAIIVALIVKNDTLLVALCGAAATNATTAVQWWLGSSKGSADKSATIERQGAQLATMTPDVPKPGAQGAA